MIRTFFIFSPIPELRADPPAYDGFFKSVEILIEITDYQLIRDYIQELRRRSLSGLSNHSIYRNIYHIILKCVVFEKERIWFRQNFKDYYPIFDI
jgi:hypothetical protein